MLIVKHKQRDGTVAFYSGTDVIYKPYAFSETVIEVCIDLCGREVARIGSDIDREECWVFDNREHELAHWVIGKTAPREFNAEEKRVEG